MPVCVFVSGARSTSLTSKREEAVRCRPTGLDKQLPLVRTPLVLDTAISFLSQLIRRLLEAVFEVIAHEECLEVSGCLGVCPSSVKLHTCLVPVSLCVCVHLCMRGKVDLL